jgi:hypothetical protein
VLPLAVMLPADAVPLVIYNSFFEETASCGLYAGLGIGGAVVAAAGDVTPANSSI